LAVISAFNREETVPEYNTFSIVACCPRTGLLGVAVATAVPAVGSTCPYSRAGVGAVSTQSWVNPYLAIAVLDAIASGQDATRALDAAISADDASSLRQLGVVDHNGHAAAWSGADCTPWFGHVIGDGFAVQGNMLVGPDTIAAMAQAFRSSEACPLDERLMRALEAGDEAGGDRRGKQSAALRIHGTETYPALDLRVDEHPDPIPELRRILTIGRLQLAPFVAAMPKHDAPAGPPPDYIKALLALPPPSRPGGGGASPTKNAAK
jgi:uncharacterized Ntn-hydrolase superfamily protein